jgi:hypothetical protein
MAKKKRQRRDTQPGEEIDGIGLTGVGMTTAIGSK